MKSSLRKKDFPVRNDGTPPQSEKDELKAQLLKKQTRYEGHNRYYYYCKICEHPFREEYLEIDHEFPKSLRGKWKLDNLQLICSRCNRRKGSTKTNEQVESELRAEGLLYHQRAEVYRELTGDSMRDSEEIVEKHIRAAEALWEKYMSGRLLIKKEKEYLSLMTDNYGCLDYGKRWWICRCGAVNDDCSPKCKKCFFGFRDKKQKLFKYKPAEQLKIELRTR